jgi:AraC family transcriptional regulator, arabinose operon regulatory protein
VEAMAALAGMSAGHFSGLFRRQTGSPPLTFLIRLRLQLACRILEQEQETIERTASRVGYEDAYYFSRLFRKHLGVVPSRFRRDARAGR